MPNNSITIKLSKDKQLKLSPCEIPGVPYSASGCLFYGKHQKKFDVSISAVKSGNIYYLSLDLRPFPITKKEYKIADRAISFFLKNNPSE